jgi:hypothetical protein
VWGAGRSAVQHGTVCGITWSHRGWFEGEGPFHLPCEPTRSILSAHGRETHVEREALALEVGRRWPVLLATKQCGRVVLLRESAFKPARLTPLSPQRVLGLLALVVERLDRGQLGCGHHDQHSDALVGALQRQHADRLKILHELRFRHLENVLVKHLRPCTAMSSSVSGTARWTFSRNPHAPWRIEGQQRTARSHHDCRGGQSPCRS